MGRRTYAGSAPEDRCMLRAEILCVHFPSAMAHWNVPPAYPHLMFSSVYFMIPIKLFNLMEAYKKRDCLLILNRPPEDIKIQVISI